MPDFIKAAFIFPAYLVGGPLLGIAIAGKRGWERAIFCLMVFMTAWQPSKITMMLGSIERYRGHTKGFEACWIEVLAIALIVAAARSRGPGYRLWPPGASIYLCWCGLMLISIFHAYQVSYVWMAFFKFTLAVLLYVAAAHFLREERDLTALLKTLAGMVLLMTFICLKMRFIEGRFRTVGWFEHQNPMAVWSYIAALPLLAMSLRAETPPKEMWLYLAGVGGAGLNVLLSVSRAALGAFAVGCALIMLLAFLRGPSKRLWGLTALGGVAAVLVVTTAMHSFFARMKEEKDRGAEEDLRVVMIAQAKLMLHDSPIGIGWNNYGIADSEPISRYSQIMEDWDASRGFTVYEENYLANPLTESYYWLVLGENGYPGIFGCALFFGATVYFALRCTLAYWRTAFGWFSGGMLVALTLLYAHSNLERVLSQTKNMAEWLLLAGCIAGLEMRRRQASAAPARPAPAKQLR